MKTLTVIDDDKIMIDNRVFICLDKKKEPKPEFKVGDWVQWSYGGTKEIYRLKEIGGTTGRTDDGLNFRLENCRLATPQEIESHLRKIADEKYIGKNILSVITGIEYKNITSFHRYSCISDELFYNIDENSDTPCLYCRGKWAEISPEKKKLPKTKEDFTNILLDFASKCDFKKTQYISVHTFLEDYED